MTRFFALFWLCLTLALPLAAQENQRRFITVEDARIYVEAVDVLRALDPGHRVTIEVREGRLSLAGTLTDPASMDVIDARLARIDGVRQIDSDLTLTNDLSDRLAPFARRLRAQFDWLVDALPLLGVALGGWAAIGWLGYVAAARRWPWDRIAPNPFIAELLRTMVRLLALAGGAVIALDILGASALLGTLLGAAGILGLAVAHSIKGRRCHRVISWHRRSRAGGHRV
jgi:small conductance mechanosensitive channel